MAALNLVLYLHHSHVLKPYSFLDIGVKQSYFDEDLTEENFRHSVEKSQIPIVEILSKSLKDSESKFKIALSISGLALEMISRDEPILLKELKSLAKTGKIEFLCHPYYGSLASLYSTSEFERQISLHKAAIKKHFGKEPKVFQNTGLIFDDKTAETLKNLKMTAAIMEGANQVVSSPNHVFQTTCGLPVLARNYGLSDNLTFRNWGHHPFNAAEFATWVRQATGDVATVLVEWDLFGVNHSPESGIFTFFEELTKQDIDFVLPSEAVSQFEAKKTVSIEEPTSWFGAEKDLSGWLASNMQTDALQKLYSLEPFVKKGSQEMGIWSNLQSANYFQSMGVESSQTGSPYETFIFYMNILSDLDEKLRPAPSPEKNSRKRASTNKKSTEVPKLKPRTV